jgi:hypothetical protein
MGGIADCPDGELKQKSIAVPVSATVCGLLGALSARVKDALLAICVPHWAACVGVNAKLMVHALPGGVLPDAHESFVMEKSLLLTPTVVNAREPADPVALFVTVTGCGGPVVPASRLPKLTLGGTETAGAAVAAVALPASGTTKVWMVPPDKS